MNDKSKTQSLTCEESIMLEQTSYVALAGEVSLGSGEAMYLKSYINHHRSDYIITNKRIIVWSRKNNGIIGLFGIFAESGPAYLTRSITFQIPWSRLAGVTKGRYGLAGTLDFKTTNGEEFRLVSNSYGKEKPRLYAAIKAATGIDL